MLKLVIDAFKLHAADDFSRQHFHMHFFAADQGLILSVPFDHDYNCLPCLFVWVLRPSQQLWSCRDGQFT